jgi:hypothetical protein
MSERGEGGGELGCGLGCLVALVVIIWLAKAMITWLVDTVITWVIPIAIPITLVALLVENRNEIWQAHMTAGRWMVQMVRDFPVRIAWSGSGGRRTVWLLVIFWLVVWPGLLMYALVRGGSRLCTVMIDSASSLMLSRFIFSPMLLLYDDPSFWGLVLALVYAGAILYGYYFYYFKGPLKDPRLVRFAQEPFLLQGEIRLALTDWSTQVRLWLLKRMFALRRQVIIRLTAGRDQDVR